MRAVSSALRISSTCPKSFGLRAFQQSLSTKYSPVYTRLDGVPVLTLEARDVRSFENRFSGFFGGSKTILFFQSIEIHFYSIG